MQKVSKPCNIVFQAAKIHIKDLWHGVHIFVRGLDDICNRLSEGLDDGSAEGFC